jgi:hypothetical protein
MTKLPGKIQIGLRTAQTGKSPLMNWMIGKNLKLVNKLWLLNPRLQNHLLQNHNNPPLL